MCDIYLILFVYENYVTSIKYPFSIIYNKTCIDIQGRLCTVLFHGRIGTGPVPIRPWNSRVHNRP